MGHQQVIIDLIRSLSGQANILSIPRLYIELTGSLDVALFFSQVLYWSDKGKRGHGWFWKTHKDWESDTSLSKYQVMKGTKWMKDRGLLQTKVKKANGGNPTVHYRVNIDKVFRFINSHVAKKHLTGDDRLDVSSYGTTEDEAEAWAALGSG